MKKREEFAVSLRKKKTHEIINAKRRKMVGNLYDDPAASQQSNQDEPHVAAQYKGHEKYETDFDKRLEMICPQAINDRSLQIVRILTDNKLIVPIR